MAPDVRRWLPYEDAKAAVRAAGITTQVAYRQRYRTVPGLPSTPLYAYAGDWEGWPAFLGLTSRFLELEAAMTAVQALGIRTQYEYVERYWEAPGLPSNPNTTYGAQWPGWGAFLASGQARRRTPATFGATQALVRQLGLRTRREYLQAAEHDHRLPRVPSAFRDWPGWETFLDVEDAGHTPLSYEQARAAVQAAGITTSREYNARYGEVAGLPSTPPVAYAGEWPGWPQFLAARVSPFLSYEDASLVARRAGIQSAREYQTSYKRYPGLPSMPQSVYGTQWAGWRSFLRKGG